MDKELLTLAIHTKTKAEMLKSILERKQIKTYLSKVESGGPYNEQMPDSYFIKIYRTDLPKALPIIEMLQPLYVEDPNKHLIDDGRKRILVAVDFTENSIKACQIAFYIAKSMNAKVKILHVYYNIYFPSHIPFADQLKTTPNEGLLNKTRTQMLNLCLEIDQKITAGQWPSVNYSYSLREGVVEEEIESFVLEYKPCLLVLGTKGKFISAEDRISNITGDIIEMTNVPVLVMPGNSPINNIMDIKHIAFLTNLQERDMASFGILVNIFKPYPHIKITLIHINRISGKGEKWPEKELIQMKDYILNKYPQFNINYKLIDSSDMAGSIVKFVKDENVSIVCANTRRRNIFERIFSPSFSRKILLKSNTAIFVFRG